MISRTSREYCAVIHPDVTSLQHYPSHVTPVGLSAQVIRQLPTLRKIPFGPIRFDGAFWKLKSGADAKVRGLYDQYND
jgi:hypothetical protein